MAEQLTQPVEGESASPAESGLLDHLRLICASKVFENSATLKNLLIYLFHHRSETINEYAIAVEVLNRRPNFDPHIDATVRVQIARLRRRLKEFYLSEGCHASIRFTIPLGTHQLALDGTPGDGQLLPGELAKHLNQQAEETHSQPAKRTLSESRIVVALSCLVAVLAVVCGWLTWQLNLQASISSPAQLPALLPFWREFASNHKPIHIVIPNPTFFSWQTPNGSNLLVRDTLVNGFGNLDESSQLVQLKMQLGKPRLGQFYVVSSDVEASIKLMDYLNSGNANSDVTFSSNASIELLEDKNTVLIGTPGTLAPLKQQLDRLYFKFDPQGRLLLNPNPAPRESRQFAQMDESSTRTIYPGLIAFVPGSSNNSHLLILVGQQTNALISYLTSMSGSRQLQEARSRVEKNGFFEAVILSEVDGDTVLNNTLAAIRAYPPTRARE